MVGQASSLSIKNDGQDARRHRGVGAGLKPALGCVCRKRFYGPGSKASPTIGSDRRPCRSIWLNFPVASPTPILKGL